MCQVLVSCRVSDSELSSDPAANLLTSASEEAQKVARNEGKVIQHKLILSISQFWQLPSCKLLRLCCTVSPTAALCFAILLSTYGLVNQETYVLYNDLSV